MKKEIKEKLEKEIKEISEEIRLKEIEIKENPPYLLAEEIMKEKIDEKDKIEKEINTINQEISQKYTGRRWSYYRGLKFSDIKPSVKQGIKKGLGVTNITIIKDNIVRIVKQLMNKDIEDLGREELKKKGEDFNEEIRKLRSDKIGRAHV